MGRAQVSVEYMIIVGLALGLLIPAVFFFLKYSEASRANEQTSQVNDIGLQVISAAKSAYALGNNARKSVEFITPDIVTNISINPAAPYEFVIDYETSAGRSQAVFFSSVQLVTTDTSGAVSGAHPGRTRLRIESQGSKVNITEVFT